MLKNVLESCTIFTWGPWVTFWWKYSTLLTVFPLLENFPLGLILVFSFLDDLCDGRDCKLLFCRKQWVATRNLLSTDFIQSQSWVQSFPDTSRFLVARRFAFRYSFWLLIFSSKEWSRSTCLSFEVFKMFVEPVATLRDKRHLGKPGDDRKA